MEPLEDSFVIDIDEPAQNSCAHLYLRPPYGREEKDDYCNKGRPLYKAASNGKWEDVEKIFEEDPNAGRAYITEGFETPLHISALANNSDFFTNLVEHMDPEDLSITNGKGNTALCLAAANGNVDIAEALMVKHPQLGNIRGLAGNGILPVMMAAKLGNGTMVEKLFDRTILTEAEYTELLQDCIASDLFDSAMKIVEKKPQLAVSDTEVLKLLATKPMAERSKKKIWESFFGWGMKEAESKQVKALKLLKEILSCGFTENDLNIENIVEIASQLLQDAAEQGNFHLFKWLIYYYPELVWKNNTNSVSMFHVAVQHGHESIFNLLHDMDEVRKLVTLYEDNNNNNMLHLAASSAPKDKLSTVTGAAFQMQQVICWYKAVEKIVPPAYRNKKNANGKTPGDIFDQAHEKLLNEGEKWMKNTAKSCMLVTALTATVIFESAFTVPGGNDEEGYPHFLNRPCFEFLTVSEVIGMLSSSTSILIFLSILTSRVNKYAFQRSLPCKLMIGFTALFISIASMVISFCATIYLSYRHTWISGLLLLLACVPVMFISLKIRLLVDIICSTFV